MNDPHAINRSINNIMNKYITEQGYEDSVLFESKVMVHSTSIMFTMMMKQGLLKVEPFKAVFPIAFFQQCEEDSIVNMICAMFKGIIAQCEKLRNVDVDKSVSDFRMNI
jgi:hypothetical protein